MALHFTGTRNISVESMTLEGGGVLLEGTEVGFYSNGTACTQITGSGHLSLTAHGTLADGRGPRFEVARGEQQTSLEADEQARQLRVGPVSEGQRVCIRYEDDLIDSSGNDRNLWVSQLEITP